MVARRQSEIYPHQSPLADEFSGDWHDYIQISDKFTKAEKAFLEENITFSIKEMPELREHLRRSQNLYCTHYLTGKPKANQKVLLEPPSLHELPRNSANNSQRIITLDLHDMLKGYYKDSKTRKKVKHSFQRILLHEFEHISDPEIVRNDINYNRMMNAFITAAKADIISNNTSLTGEMLNNAEKIALFEYQKLQHTIFEEYTVHRNDHAHERHFGEPRREQYENGHVHLNHVLSNRLLPEDIIKYTQSSKKIHQIQSLLGIKPKLHKHTQTDHDKSFIALPVIDVIDPERERLAVLFNSYIESIIQMHKSDFEQTRESNKTSKNQQFDLAEYTQNFHDFQQFMRVEMLNDEIPTALKQDTPAINRMRQIYEEAIDYHSRTNQLPESQLQSFVAKLNEERAQNPNAPQTQR